jgi:hypothetical protein
MSSHKPSDFYWACRKGDVDAVKKILPKLSLNDIDRMEPNGSTALHAAAYYGHAKIVQLLFEQGANTRIHNIYGVTPKQEASTDEVRAMFASVVEIEEESEDDEDYDGIPQSVFLQIYPNKERMKKSELATRILKARMSTYNVHKYTISATSNLEHLERKYRKVCEEKRDPHALHMGEEFLNKYRKTGDFSHMIRFYTAETPFYRMIQDDDTFLIEMYKHLLRYDELTFCGCTYRGIQLSPKDLEPYQWALTHPRSLLEIRKMLSTSPNLPMVHGFIARRLDEGRTVLLQFDFAERCFTAIDIKALSYYSEENEVLILSGTFFEVTQIQEDDNGLITISLKYVPVDKNVLSAII